MSLFTSPRGTRDILPEECHIWQLIETTCRRLFSHYCYQELQTPLFENTKLFNQGIGDDTEIVEKEMYTFEDKGGRSLTLRPEGTAAVVRAAIQNQLIKKKDSLKLFYSGSFFRYERPQAGRYRQFNQIGIENIGIKDPRVDAEVISLAYSIFTELGLKNVSVLINSIGCSISRPVIEERIRQFLSNNLSHLPEKLQEKFHKNPMRILDSKDDIAQKYLIGMPDIKDVLSQESKDHFYSVLDHLENLKVPFTVKNTLVRGLDYYTETVFEIVSDDLGTKNTVCGGGRYNDLISQLGGGSVPAIGFAFGVERLAQLVMAQHPDQSSSKPIHLIGLGDMPKSKIFNLAHKLRHSGISCDIGYDDQLKTQLKKASQKGCPFVVIIGEEELDKKIALVKNMTTREQEEVPISKLTGFLKKGL